MKIFLKSVQHQKISLQLVDGQTFEVKYAYAYAFAYAYVYDIIVLDIITSKSPKLLRYFLSVNNSIFLFSLKYCK